MSLSQHNMEMSEGDIRDAFDAIIAGHLVKRDHHSLVWERIDYTALFIERLRAAGYIAKTVAQTNVEPGQRSPAFHIKSPLAHFGWVKWTKYDAGVYIKYFASEKRKRSGTPIIMIQPDDPQLLFVSDHIKELHDPDRPPMYE